MTLGLHNLKTKSGAKKIKRRVGRGNASKGNYAGRGMKGQKSRSGGKSGLKLRGVKGYLQRIPKTKGFKSLKPKNEEVNIGELNTLFNNSEEVTPRILLAKGVIKTIKNGVKVLGQGTLNKKLIVKANAFTEKAKKEIEKAGGQVEVIAKKQTYPKNKPQPKADEPMAQVKK